MQEFVLQGGKMYIDDAVHRFTIGKADVMKKAAPEKGVRQLLFVVRRDDYNRTMPSLDRTARLVDVELHPIEFEQQIVRKFDVSLVDLVDQQDRRHWRLERLPELSRHNVVADIVDALVAELAVAEARIRIVFVKALLRFGRGFDVPGDQIPSDGAGNLMRQYCLAAPRLTFDEQRALQRDRGIDRNLQVRRHYISSGARETVHARPTNPWPFPSCALDITRASP